MRAIYTLYSTYFYPPLIDATLVMAHKRRGTLEGAVFHSDRGSQYASKEYRELLKSTIGGLTDH